MADEVDLYIRTLKAGASSPLTDETVLFLPWTTWKYSDVVQYIFWVLDYQENN